MIPRPSDVAPEVWAYVNSVDVAGQYDRDHAAFPLFDLDRRLTLDLLHGAQASLGGARSPILLDLGCGTGRTLIAAATAGARAWGIDLSPHMLERAAENVAAAGVGHAVRLLRSNMTDLSFLDDGCVDVAVCLYATLGLLRRRAARLTMLRGVRRVLRPGGRLLVHVHNRYYPGLRARHWCSLWRAWREARRAGGEFGDLYFDDYAGAAVRRMFMHAFGPRELREHLEAAGFADVDVRYIHPSRVRLLDSGPLRTLRSHGLFAVATKPAAGRSGP